MPTAKAIIWLGCMPSRVRPSLVVLVVAIGGTSCRCSGAPHCSRAAVDHPFHTAPPFRRNPDDVSGGVLTTTACRAVSRCTVGQVLVEPQLHHGELPQEVGAARRAVAVGLGEEPSHVG